jgi:alpha-glucosidase
MMPGPLDYTPGAMNNATRDNFFGNNNHPMSQGTRVHQMAMYIIYDAPLQMLADSPTNYKHNQECTDFISQIPTTFDETVALAGEMGEYVAIAKRKGSRWYVAAMTNWTPRTISLPLGELNNIGTRAKVFRDGINADKDATDYRAENITLNGNSINVELAPGGGWAAIIE